MLVSLFAAVFPGDLDGLVATFLEVAIEPVADTVAKDRPGFFVAEKTSGVIGMLSMASTGVDHGSVAHFLLRVVDAVVIREREQASHRDVQDQESGQFVVHW